jgi:hypothetical protein
MATGTNNCFVGDYSMEAVVGGPGDGVRRLEKRERVG